MIDFEIRSNTAIGFILVVIARIVGIGGSFRFRKVAQLN